MTLAKSSFALEQQLADFEKVAIHGKLLDRVAAIQQLALVAVDIGNRRFATARRHESGVEGERTRIGIEGADIDHIRADGAGIYGKLDRVAVDRERRFTF